MDCLKYLPAELREEVEAGSAAVVGGAIRCHLEGATPKDIDVFFFSREGYERAVERHGATPIEGADNNLREFSHEGMRIELVYQQGLHAPKHCVEAADFDLASGVYCTGRILSAPSLEEAVRTKVFRYLAPTHSGGGSARRSYHRSMKYQGYGYRIDESVHLLLQRWQEETC